MMSPRSVLLAYMKDMNEWELACAHREHECDAGRMDYRVAATLGTSEYMAIFGKYGSCTAAPREYHFTEPPDYDPIGETIISENEQRPGIVEIRTQQNYSHRKMHIFRMALEHGE